MCTREELEAHFQVAKEYALLRGDIAALRKQGVRPGEAYRQVVGSRSNPLLSRYYAPTLYAYAMTAPVEQVAQDAPAPQPEPIIEQEKQEEVPAALPGGETSEQDEIKDTPIEFTPVEVSPVSDRTPVREQGESSPAVPAPEPVPIGVVLDLLPARIEYEDQSHADTLSSSAESDQMQPDCLVIQFSQDETLEVTSQMFDYLLRQTVQEFEQKVNKEETQ